MRKRSIVVSILSVLFIILIVLIKCNIIDTFDEKVYQLVTFKMNDALTMIFKIFTFLGSTAFIVGLVIFFFVLFIVLKKNNHGYVVASVLIISTIMNNLVKIIVRRGRPDVLKLVIEKSYSFPSGHTMAAVSMYGLLIYLISKSNINKTLKTILSVILGILPILIAVSRIYLGAHYASDVIGGAILSSILLLIETYIIDKKEWI